MGTKNFCLVLGFILAITFFLHISFLKFLGNNLWDDLIVESYIFNTILAGGIYSLLGYSIKKKSLYVGWFFLIGSLVKLSLFFLFFYPFFIQDEIIEKKEIFSFFVPYSVSVIFETYNFVKMLKNF